MIPAGFILAGGRSRRMGTDKSELPWGRRRLVDHMKTLVGQVADPVRVVGPGGLADREPGAGPVEGILTALRATRAPVNIVVAVDLPFLSPAFLRFLETRLIDSRTSLVACNVEANIPLAIGVHRDALALVDGYRAEGERSIRGLLATAGAHIVADTEFREAGFDPEMFRNLNTPEQYARYRPDPEEAV